MTRKIWIKRPGASPTMVRIADDDLVDDVRDQVMQKYANSLGRTCDAPDVIVRIAARTDGQRLVPERILSPEEPICQILDAYYPNGQTIEFALLIEVLPRRTPRVSPRPHPLQHHVALQNAYNALETSRPEETSTDYFPPMPAVVTTNHGPATAGVLAQPHGLQMPEHARSISVLQTGQVPPLPSPGVTRRHRPKYARQHTSSPTITSHSNSSSNIGPTSQPMQLPQHFLLRNHNRPRLDSHATDRPNGMSAIAPPLPTPPPNEGPPLLQQGSTPPTPSARDHRTGRPRKNRRPTPTNATSGAKPTPSTALPLDHSVPPINVLIVEDNHINLKVLEAFMKRLRVRWSTAMNGQIAVNKWRAGGFHLVLMDIQLPIMNGLEATKEIRRLERVNNIGVFSNSAPTTPYSKARQKSTDAALEGLQPDQYTAEQAAAAAAAVEGGNDKLVKDDGLFKSPVIIVALTASSLQSDRHEALAAGCNDFLTKPVNFTWLERKVKEWGCMQALIDFDGWRKWKDFATHDQAAVSQARSSITTPPKDIADGTGIDKTLKDKKEKKKKVSLGSSEPSAVAAGS